MTTRADIRHLHLVEGVPKRELARRYGVKIKTVRRHVQGGEEYPARNTPKRGRALDDHRAEIETLLQDDGKLTAKRIGRLLEKKHGIQASARSIRRYVNDVRGTVRKPEAFERSWVGYRTVKNLDVTVRGGGVPVIVPLRRYN